MSQADISQTLMATWTQVPGHVPVLPSRMSQLNDYTPDELDAIWVSYQTENGAACPYCGSVLEFALTEDALESGGDAPPKVTVTCPGCGRKAINEPGERNDSEQDPT